MSKDLSIDERWSKMDFNYGYNGVFGALKEHATAPVSIN
jgi:hypothetical protein